jgi:hypothetical protein
VLPITGQTQALCQQTFFIQQQFFMQHTSQLSRLMRMSWEIQRRKKHTESKALQGAWAICQNEDVTIFHLVQRPNQSQRQNIPRAQTLSLFRNS